MSCSLRLLPHPTRQPPPQPQVCVIPYAYIPYTHPSRPDHPDAPLAYHYCHCYFPILCQSRPTQLSSRTHPAVRCAHERSARPDLTRLLTCRSDPCVPTSSQPQSTIPTLTHSLTTHSPIHPPLNPFKTLTSPSLHESRLTSLVRRIFLFISASSYCSRCHITPCLSLITNSTATRASRWT